MRIGDALGAMFRKKEDKPYIPLTTVWSEQADDAKDVPLAEYPRPQMARREWECLNGWWEYAITGRAERFSAPDGKILVPFSPESARSGVERTLKPEEALWYRREIRIGEKRAGARLLLHFGAVDERCTVWWNGKRLGAHRGGYLPFSFDVTEYVRAGRNTLMLRVLDASDAGTACRGKQKLAPGGMFYSAQSGIWQTVWMEWVPENDIRELVITPDPAKGEVEIGVRMAVPAAGRIRILPDDRETDSGSDNPAAGAAEARQEEFPEQPAAEARREEFSEKSAIEAAWCEEDFDASGLTRVRIPLADPHLWTPEDPYLYTLQIAAGEDSVSSYFAMRSFGTGTDAAGRPCLLLNGKPYFFHGVLDQGYWPESLMTAPSDEAMIFDIAQMKDAGFNMLRKHVKVEPLRWYAHCDRLGMVVWQDMVNGGGEIPALLCTYLPTGVPALGRHLRDDAYALLARKDGKARQLFEEQLEEMIRTLYSVPCIGMWVIFNEGWGQFDAARLAETVRRLDPTRVIDHASGWFDQGAGDVRSVHNYFRELTVEEDAGGRPFVLSEYGGLACDIPGHVASEHAYGYHTETPETFPQSFRALMDRVRSLAGRGLAGAVYTQVSDIQEERNGLLTYDRKVRKDRNPQPQNGVDLPYNS